MKYFICLLYILVLNQWIQAQPNEKIKFHRINSGISSNWVLSILQDRQGFMWFGTESGLNKYDGYSFINYEYNSLNPNSIGKSNILNIYEDKSGNLWISTDGDGLTYFNRKTEKFKIYRQGSDNQQISSDVVKMVQEDEQGIFWIAVKEGLNSFDPKTGKFQHYIFKNYQDGVIQSNAILAINERYIWMIIDQYGLVRFDKKNKKYYHFTKENSGLKENIIRTACKSKEKNKYWLGYQSKGLDLISLVNDHIIFEKNYTHNPNDAQSLTGDNILSICEDKYKRLWVGVENKGLSILNPTTNTFSNYKHNNKDEFSLAHDSPWSIYEDSFGNMWIGTFNQGVNVVYNQYYDKFTHIKQKGNDLSELVNNNVTCFSETTDGKIWIGTDGGGVSLWDRQKDKFTNYFKGDKSASQISVNAIFSIFQDSKERVWFGTWQGGINIFDPQTQKFSHYTTQNQGLSSNTHFSLINTHDNKVYLSNWSRDLDVFDLETQKVIWSRSFLDDDVGFFYRIIEDRKKNIWIGSAKGLLLITPENRHPKGKVKIFKHQINQPNSISDSDINDIYEDSKGNIWVGTRSGLNLYIPDNQSFKIYREKDGVANENIRGIIEDNEGFLWITTNKGLSRFDIQRKSFENYGKEDGLQGDKFTKRAIYKTISGEILIGGSNGFNLFNPTKLKKNPIPPKIYLTGLKIFNKPVEIGAKNSPLRERIEYASAITLNHKQSVFTIEFVALNYIRSSKNQYAYKLEGLENNWNYVGDQRSATYTNLDAGTYTFIVKAANNDGVWSEEDVRLTIIILPPWWKTWWFSSLILLTIILLTFIGFRWRIRIIQKQNIQLEQLVKERTIELKEKNEMLEVQAEEINRMNDLLNKENEQLQVGIKELTKARVMMQEVDFNEFCKIFPNDDSCYQYLAELKWQNGYQCARCSNTKYAVGSGHYARRCTKCAYNESSTSKTIFHHSHLPIQKAFFMLFLVYANKDNITSIELSQILKMRQPSCWKFRNKILEKLKSKGDKHTHLDNWSQLILE
jgi:ligand-binding sensor domain-containing protein